MTDECAWLRNRLRLRRFGRGAVALEERFERGRCGEVVALTEHAFELFLRVDRRLERVARIELQRAHQPGAEAGGQRLEPAAGRDGPRRRHQIAEARGCFLVVQAASEDQRQRDDTDLRDVGAMIEFRQPRGARHRDAQLAPVALLREAQLLERGSHYVLDDDQARARGDDQTLRGNRAMRGVGLVLVQHRHRGYQLAQQAERGVDVERDFRRLGEAQHLGQPQSLGDVGDEREGGSGIFQPFDAAHVAVARVAEGREIAEALAQRELERGHGRELAAEAEHFDRLVARAIDGEPAGAEAVLESDPCRRGC